ncbi:hypothetical protein Tco_0205669 [Tanacetum coccineum]
MVEDDKDEETYAVSFLIPMSKDMLMISGSKIKTEIHKEYLEKVNDDDEEIEKKMKDDKIDKGETNDNVEKTNVVRILQKSQENDQNRTITDTGTEFECAKSGRMLSRDIFKIRPRVQGQDFDALPTDEEIVSFLRDLGHTGEIHSLNDVVVDQMHQP